MPTFELLGEMLLHFTHLMEDIDADLKDQPAQLTANFRVALETVRGLHAEHTGRAERVMEHVVGRVEAAAAAIGMQRIAVLATFKEDTEQLLRNTVIRHARTRIWADRMMVVVLLIILTGAAHWYGYRLGNQQAMAELLSTNPGGAPILMRRGTEVGLHWINLADWNDLDRAKPNCEPRESGPGYRKACTYLFWDGPPLLTPPPR